MKYQLKITNSFKRDYKKMIKRGYDPLLIKNIVDKLLNGEKLPDKNKDHDLKGDWAGFRECHIQPDWLLVYRIKNDILTLTLSRTGSHSDLDF